MSPAPRRAPAAVDRTGRRTRIAFRREAAVAIRHLTGAPSPAERAFGGWLSTWLPAPSATRWTSSTRTDPSTGPDDVPVTRSTITDGED